MTISKRRAGLAVAFVVMMVGAARAAPVADVVTRFMKHNQEPKQLAPLLRADAIVVADGAIARNATGDDAATYLMWFKTRSVAPVQVKTAGHVAWFQTTAEAETFDQTGDSCEHHDCSPQPLHFHVSGAAIDGKLAVVIVTRTWSDPDLIGQARRQHTEAAPATATIAGDHDLAAAATTWLAGKLGASAAADAFASGTEAKEIAQGTAAAKLAGNWDKLALAAVSVEATQLPGLGFVFADMRWPYKGQPVALRLAAIALRDHDAWKWVVLDFAS